MIPSGLRIGFLLGSPEISGGTYVIYEHATRLLDKGHSVFMICENTVMPQSMNWHDRACNLGWQSLEEAQSLHYDVVIATWWQSAFLLAKIEALHYVYFVQSIESRFFEKEDPTVHDRRDLDGWRRYCESTYTLNIPVITEASWIKKYLYEKYNRHCHLVHNGIRKDIYCQEGKTLAPRKNGLFRVLVEGPVDVHFKNVPKAIALAQKAGADEIWLLTSSAIDSYEGVDRVFSKIAIHDTPPIYRSCDVLVKLSYVEGMFGPPLEMFHCGGTAIVYDVTGHDEYIVHEENSYVVAKDLDQQVVLYLKKLKNEPKLLARLQKGALDTASTWPDWDDAAGNFAKALEAILAAPVPSRKYLQDWAVLQEQEREKIFFQREVQRFLAREEVDTGFADYRDRHNFAQFYYWDEEEGLLPDNCKTEYYQSGEKTELQVVLPVRGSSYWLRIDPSVRMGIILIHYLEIKDPVTKAVYVRYDDEAGMKSLYVSGSLKRMEIAKENLFLATGDDPRLLLPSLDARTLGDEVLIAVCLEEYSVREFMEKRARQARREKEQAGRKRSLIKKIVDRI